MKGFAEIKTQPEMEAMIQHIDGFHDAMAKEIHWKRIKGQPRTRGIRLCDDHTTSAVSREAR